jgi:hypothetical protein
VMIILGNVMLQVGMEVGEKVVSEGHSLRGLPAGSEREPGAGAGGEETPPGSRVRSEAPGDETTSTGKTAAGTIPPGGREPLPEGEMAAEVRDVLSPESLFKRLAEEGMRRDPSDPGPPPKTDIAPGKPRTGIRDVHEAYRLYDEALRANGGKREVGIFHNSKTGEYSVAVGGETSVGPPSDGGSWEGVLHYHPNPQAARQFGLPAPADFLDMMRKFVATGSSVREFLEYEMPSIGRGRTEFGITAGAEMPFYVTVFLPDGTSSTFRFANDGTYAAFWGGAKTYVDPDSALYRQMIHDIPDYLKNIDSARDSPASAPSSGPTKTAAGVSTPSALTTARGDLTDQGIAFLRGKFPKRFKGVSAEQIRHEFAGQDSGDLLEAVGKEEVRQSRRALGAEGTSLLFDANRQKLSSIATKLARSVAVDSSVLRQSVLEFVRTQMPEAYDFMNSHPDPAVRRVWLEFAWGSQSGAKRGNGFLMGVVGNKEPDVVEVFPNQREVVVTDTTHRATDPIHNFKTLFYATVLGRMTGFETHALDYRSVFRMTPVETPGAAGGRNTP